MTRKSKDHSFNERLATYAEKMKEAARLLPAGQERDEALKKARQVDVATHLQEWLSSPGLAPPR
jgi:hypothetical protein